MNIYTTKEFIKKANIIHNFKYSYSETQYIHSKTKVIISCKIHGFFKQNPSAHLLGYGCPICGANLSNTKSFIEKSNKIHNFKYLYDKVKYVNCKTKVNILCPLHGNFFQRPQDHLRGQNCPKCARKLTVDSKRLNTTAFIQKAKMIYGNRFDYSKTIFVHSNQNIYITCKIHGDFKQRPNNHLTGQGCPKCKSSKGEQEIQTFLENSNILYESQYKIKDCYNKRTLPFDFALFNKEKHLLCLIEYQGRQHYKSISIWGGEKNLQYIQINDAIKLNYCIENNIPLLTIPYWDFSNIKNLIEKFIFS